MRAMPSEGDRRLSAGIDALSDIACRYGGEELVLVLPDCDLHNTETRLQHICAEIRRKRSCFAARRCARNHVVGLSQISDDLTSADALITAADWAHYRQTQRT